MARSYATDQGSLKIASKACPFESPLNLLENLRTAFSNAGSDVDGVNGIITAGRQPMRAHFDIQRWNVQLTFTSF
jgi:hypothetical protein